MVSIKCKVYTESGNPAMLVDIDADTCAEDVVFKLCRGMKVSPITRPLFALRRHGTSLFVSDGARVENNSEYDLRIRFKPTNLDNLPNLDMVTFNYLYMQARNDLRIGAVTDIKYSEHKDDLVGLGTVDMFRAVLEDGKSPAAVKKDYSKYIPKIIIKKHKFFTKKPVCLKLDEFIEHNEKTWKHKPLQIKMIYLDHLFTLAPNYLCEVYPVQFGALSNKMSVGFIEVNPFHSTQPGLIVYTSNKQESTHICKIEDLICLGRKNVERAQDSQTDDNTRAATRNQLDVYRKNGMPYTLKFCSPNELSSFISAANGYYRLKVKWTFDLSTDDQTPSLERLAAMKCHGPVGGKFAYHKLEEKGRNEHGAYILRQCHEQYDVYYIDYCKNKTRDTLKVVARDDGFHTSSEPDKTFSSLEELARSLNTEELPLKRCIPPSQYDKTQLLLCSKPSTVGHNLKEDEINEKLKNKHNPIYIRNKEIFPYYGTQMRGVSGKTLTYRADWHMDEDNKMSVALKIFSSEESSSYLQDFLELAKSWSLVRSTSVVLLYGISFTSPKAFVMEYLPYGPLDKYLARMRKENESGWKNVDVQKQLLSAALGLARALLDLCEAGAVHGRIRCSKLLVAQADSNQLVVKLSDPGLYQYTPSDIHWIPVDLFSDFRLARRSQAADVWACGTALWEMFSFGLSPARLDPPLTQLEYEQGARLNRPPGCLKEMWLIILNCWVPDPDRRSIPQVIVRDITCLLNQVRELHSYEEVDDMEGPDMTLPDYSLGSYQLTEGVEEKVSELGAVAHRLQWIFDLGSKSTVTLECKIGYGNYGEVYRGHMMREGSNQIDVVAVKKFKSNSESSKNQDFRKEFEICQKLQNKYIVSIIGICQERETMLVMEYMEQGALNNYLRLNRNTLTERHLLKYAHDIASGMAYLAEQKVIHRDLAARNVLVKNPFHVKISDFGLARFLSDGDMYVMATMQHLPINWFSPEAAMCQVFTLANDVWSYAVTLWEMYTLGEEVPKFDINKPEQRAKVFYRPARCPQEVYLNLMKPCWSLNPDERPKFTKLVDWCQKELRHQDPFDTY